jgi:predicted metal-dependent hydrolase
MTEPPRFPPAVAAAVRDFNAGRFFEAHEAFEELLDDVEADARWDLAVALVQTSVAYHKLANGHPGGGRMLALAAEKLARFPAVAYGIDVGGLRRRVAADREAAAAGEAIRDRVRSSPPRIEFARAGRRR